jgi:molybdenum cofactor guanylyltransferase
MAAKKMAAAILAGGKSTRMGRNKAFLPFGGKPLIFFVYEALAEVFDEIFVVGSAEAGKVLGVPSYPDQGEGQKPNSLRGIFTGLTASPTVYTFFAPCDMPFLNPMALRRMRETLPDCDAFVPWSGDFWQPLHAIYSKNCLPVIEDQVIHNNFKIMQFYGKVKTCTIDMHSLENMNPALPLFFNLNTASDLAAAEQMAAKAQAQEEDSFGAKRR